MAHNNHDNHNHENTDGEIVENIKIQPKIHREYRVEIAYFKDDKENIISGHNTPELMCEHGEIMVMSYIVHSTSIEEAILEARNVDKARKMEFITGWIEPLYEKSLEYNELDFDIETLMAFRSYMIEEDGFNEFYFQEPTTIQAYLKTNKEMITNRTVSNVNKNISNIGDDMETWLNNKKDKKDNKKGDK